MTKNAKRLARLRARVIRNVRLDEVTGCWLWQRRINNDGYAVMNVRVPGRKQPVVMFAHRVAYEAFRGRRIADGKVAAHAPECPHRHCCNYLHLRATTQSENERDKVRAKRKRQYKDVRTPRHTVILEAA